MQQSRAWGAVTDQYQQMYDQGQYQQLLALLNAALNSKTTKTSAADRYALLMLKGNAQLGTKATGAASDTFTTAAAIGPDDTAVSIARGTVILIKHSGSSKYQPKAKSSSGSSETPAIDIINKTSRKDAFTALFTDMLDPLKVQVNNAASTTSLSTLMSLGKQAGDVRCLEIAGTDADAQSKDLLEKLATRGGTLLNGVINPLDKQVSAVSADAAKRQKAMGKREPANSFSSLSPDDADQLQTIISTATSAGASAAQMQPIFANAGSADEFKTIETHAEKIIADANKLLKQYHHDTN